MTRKALFLRLNLSVTGISLNSCWEGMFAERREVVDICVDARNQFYSVPVKTTYVKGIFLLHPSSVDVLLAPLQWSGWRSIVLGSSLFVSEPIQVLQDSAVLVHGPEPLSN